VQRKAIIILVILGLALSSIPILGAFSKIGKEHVLKF
jgi:hypothetical protein